MTSHLDADGLASYQAGLVTGRPGRVITTHLAGCAECAALAERLAEVSLMLAAAPLPPVPDSLLQRLDLALATEYSERPVVPASPGRLAWLRSGRSRVRSGLSWRRPASSRGASGLPWRVLAPAAAVVALAAGGYGLSQLGSSPSPSEASSGTAAGAQTRGAESVPEAGPAASGSAALEPHNQAAAPDEVGGKLSVVYSPVNYQPANLAAQLTAQVRAGLTGVKPTTPVAACVLRIADGARPTLVEVARYRGSPVTVVVVPSVSGAGYMAWLAGPGCSAGNSDIVTGVALPAGISAP
jgi:hypothetical protein